jgi:hypothetical protein
MAGFKRRSENGGLLDPNINSNGRPKTEGKLTRREIKEKELMNLLRKFNPLRAQAVAVAGRIMNNEKSSEASRLKACSIILENCKELLDKVYAGNDDEDGELIQDNTPKTAFSLVMLTAKTEESKE